MHIAAVLPKDAPKPAEPDEEPQGRSLRRTIIAVACAILGLGLLAGSVAGTWLSGGDENPDQAAYETARELWHTAEVGTLFPRTLRGEAAGPGDADRTWKRIGVAGDGDCRRAFDPNLAKALAPVGCERLLRATYADATGTHVTTVGMLFTKAGPERMQALRARFADEDLGERKDLLPLPYAVPGTPAADFGKRQRASWTVGVVTDAPVVVYSVSGFADGREVSDPQPAQTAVRAGQTTAPAQAGLGHDAQGIADRIESKLRSQAGEAAAEAGGVK
ncbi:hypothetical protein G5C51_10370 [Streptomyces sp. A7024]|uniref:Uncharacterized protein n=1 Tax=Streptomyces coryli TaxID=1128680 RepID=A0A6G4TXX9_9ACTN|nr:hypothetical protein [Streptomyces coryli]